MEKSIKNSPLNNDEGALYGTPLGTDFPEGMDNKVKEAIQMYQCPGCIYADATNCYERDKGQGCSAHIAYCDKGDKLMFYLPGMPKGFNSIDCFNRTRIHIFQSLADGWEYNKFNIPLWKHRDDNGNVLVRGFSPLFNTAWIQIFLSDCLDDIDCIEITKADMEQMN